MSVPQNTYSDLYAEIQNSGQNFIESHSLSKTSEINFDKLIICGMGGSGISADYVYIIAQQYSPKQIYVNKDYSIPSFVNTEWMSIVISYSGNTEETISSMNQLLSIGLKPICISSGGKMKELAKIHSLEFISIPEGIAPRVAFPYLFGSLFGLVYRSLNIPEISSAKLKQISNSSKQMDFKFLEAICNRIISKFPIIISASSYSNVGLRFRCQLNENSKMHSANYISPEFSHNGIVGFDSNSSDNIVLILLRSPIENTRTKIHIDFLQNNDLSVGDVIEMAFNYDDLLVSQLDLTWQLDYISVKLAELTNIDPLIVPSIVDLKEILKRS
tara:strand:+ start:5875 stop:6864 length:990 start_codon:yes stop_codon:yes gene_type:complete